MGEPPEETRVQPVEVTCPGCFHTRTWEAAAACPICKYRPRADRSGALLPVGTQLKRYVIGEKLGQGGFGITYRGFDLKLHMKVAIKEYYPSDFVGRSTDRQTVVLNAREHEELFGYGLKTFLKEARTLAQIKHPQVVRVLNYFEMHGTAYLAMDYLEGEDLTAYLKRQPNGHLPWRSAVHLLLPVLDGLRKVHEAGFMHRDLKPGNLYWTDDGLVLLDFGSARQVASPHSRSLLIYSAGYAPYEQYLEGNLTRQGPWTDVYGAAATLYFMLTAQRPPSALERKQSGLLRQPDLLKPARHWIPDMPPALDAALLRALAVEPEQRLQSMAEFKQQLEAVLATAEKPVAAKKPVAEPPPRPPVSPQPSAKPTPEPQSKPRVSPQPPAKPNRWALAITVIVAAAGLAWGGWGIGLLRTPPNPPVATSGAVTPSVAEPTLMTRSVSPVTTTTLEATATPVAEPAPMAQPAPPVTTSAQSTLEPKMARIPGGCFQMGSPTSEKDRSDDERQHQVCVESFEMGQYEVTFEEYDQFCAATKREKPRDEGWGRRKQPVINVSWADAMTYAEWLSQQTGKKYRLPTEAEWEYACRGGKEGERYCGGNDVGQMAWYGSSFVQKTADGLGQFSRPVFERPPPRHIGLKAANGFGLYDMSGNVWEWTCSVYEKKYGGAEQKCADKNTSGSMAVRGGSWDSNPDSVRSANRDWTGPSYRNTNRGFRLARSL